MPGNKDNNAAAFFSISIKHRSQIEKEILRKFYETKWFFVALM